MCDQQKDLQRQKQQEITATQEAYAQQLVRQPGAFQELANQRQTIRNLELDREKEPENANKWNRESARKKWKQEVDQKLVQARSRERSLQGNFMRLAKEEFHQPTKSALTTLTRDLKNQKTVAEKAGKPVTLGDYAYALDHSLTANQPDQPTELFGANQQLPKDLQTLLTMEKQLESWSYKSAEPEALQAMCKTFQGLKSNSHHPAAAYMDHIGLRDGDSLFVLLSACVSLALYDGIKAAGLGMETNPKAMAQLSARVAASNLAAGTMYASKTYRDFRAGEVQKDEEAKARAEAAKKAHEERLAKIQAEADAKKIADAKAKAEADLKAKEEAEAQARAIAAANAKRFHDDKINYLISGTEKKQNPYGVSANPKLAEEWLGDRLDQMNWQEFTAEVAQMNIRANEKARARVRILMDQQEKTMPSAKLRKQLTEAVWSALGAHIFDVDLSEESMELALAEAKLNLAKPIERYADHRKALTALPGLEDLPLAVLDQRVDAMLNQEDEEQFKKEAKELSEQAAFNVELVRDYIRQEVSPLGREPAFQMLTEQMTTLFLFSAPSSVMAVAENRLALLNQYAPKLAYQEKLLTQTLNDLQIPTRWRDLACRRLTEEDVTQAQMTQRLQGFREELEKKEKAYFETLEDKTLIVPQWEALNHWKDENLDLPVEEFVTRLTNLLSQEEFNQEGGLTREEYEKLEEVEAQQKPVGYRGLIQDQALCKWPMFNGIFEGAEDQVFSAFRSLVHHHKLPFPFLEDVSSIRELENVSYSQFAAVMEFVRSNMAEVAEDWSCLQILQEEQVKTALLPEMMRGKANKQNFQARVRHIQRKLGIRDQVRQLRFAEQMEKPVQDRERYQYQYIETTESSTFLNHDSRAYRRMHRMDLAAEFWAVAARIPMQAVNTEKQPYREALGKCATLEEAVRTLYTKGATDEQIRDFVEAQSKTLNENVAGLETLRHREQERKAEQTTADAVETARKKQQAAEQAETEADKMSRSNEATQASSDTTNGAELLLRGAQSSWEQALNHLQKGAGEPAQKLGRRQAEDAARDARLALQAAEAAAEVAETARKTLYTPLWDAHHKIDHLLNVRDATAEQKKEAIKELNVWQEATDRSEAARKNAENVQAEAKQILEAVQKALTAQEVPQQQKAQPAVPGVSTAKANEKTAEDCKKLDKEIKTLETTITDKLKALQKEQDPKQLRQLQQELEAARAELAQKQAERKKALEENPAYRLQMLVEQNLKSSKTSLENCLVELRFLGGEAAVLQDKTLARSFQEEERDKYVVAVQARSRELALRTEGLADVLRKWDMSPEEEKTWEKRMMPMLANLPQSLEKEDKHREEYLDRYGAASWAEALKQLDQYLGSIGKTRRASYLNPKGTKQPQVQQTSGAQEQMELLHTRKNLLNNYSDGLLRPISDQLLSDPKFWRRLMSGTDESARAYLKEKSKKLENALTALSKWNGYGREFMAQLLQWHSGDILAELTRETPLEESVWDDKFRAYYDQYTDHKEGGSSISKRLEKLKAEDVKTFQSLMTLLRDPDMGLEILKDDQSLQLAMTQSRVNLVPNQKNYEAFCAKNKLTSVEVDGVKMRVHRAMLTKSPVDFLAALPQELQAFRVKQKDAQTETQIANRKMNEKWAAMRELERTRAQARIRSSATVSEEKVAQLRKSARTNPSLLLQALGTPAVTLTEPVLRDARLVIQKKHGDLPRPVRDFMSEVLVNGYLTQKGTPAVDALVAQATADMTVEQQQAVTVVQKKLTDFITEQAVEPKLQWVQQEYDRILHMADQLELPGELTEDKIYELLLARYAGTFKPQPAGAAAPKPVVSEEQAVKNSWNGFEARQTQINELRAIHIGDPALEAQKVKALEALRYGKYTLNDQEFNQLIQERTFYFQRAAELTETIEKEVAEMEHRNAMIDEEIASWNDQITAYEAQLKQNVNSLTVNQLRDAESQLSQLQSQKTRTGEGNLPLLKAGLRETFRGYLLQSAGDQRTLPQLREQISDLLKNQLKVESIMDPSNLLTSVGSLSLTAKERSFQGEPMRSDLERFLSKLSDKAAVAPYFQLNRQQRQVFALSVLSASRVKADDRLYSSHLLRDKEVETGLHQERTQALWAYTNHQDFDPAIDYSQVLEVLQQTTRTAPGAPETVTLNTTLFSQAMMMTNVAMAQYAKNGTKDFQRLANGAESLQALETMPVIPVSLQDRKRQGERVIKKPEDFFAHVKDLSGVDLSGMSDYQRCLLIQVLQDRTLLDYSTAVPAKKSMKGGGLKTIVNVKGRERLKSRWIQDPQAVGDLPMNQVTLSNAFLTLRSYQVRDDVELKGRKLRWTDFQPSTLARTTVLDEKLLNRAVKFVREVEQESLRLNAVRQATRLIDHPKNPNKTAQAAYKQLNETYEDPRTVTREAVVDFFRKEALKKENLDGPDDPNEPKEAKLVKVKDKEKTTLMAGILELTPQQLDLFIKVLGHREFLDISKDGISADRFGIGERDYVDAKGRSALMDEYFAYANGTQGSVPLGDTGCYEALVSVLSTQVSDDLDFTQLSAEKDLTDALTSKSNAFKCARGTAVDWKLVSRALQFVHRAENERNIFLGDRAMYHAMGDISETGSFQFNSGYLRKNFHHAGTRLSRFLLRRAAIRSQDLVAMLVDELPEELAPALEFLQGPGTKLLSEENQNKLKKNPLLTAWRNNPLPPSEEEQMAAQQESANFLETMKNMGGEETPDAQPAPVEQTPEEKVKAGAQALLPVFGQMYESHKTRQLADTHTQDDQAKLEKSLEGLSSEEAERVKSAAARNEAFQKKATGLAHTRKCTEVLESVAGVAGDVLGAMAGPELSALVSAAVGEAGQLVGFLVSYCTEVSATTDYFRQSGDVERLKNRMNDMGLDTKGVSDLDLIKGGLGYEDNTELGSFVGLNLTRSLLFCASPFVATTQPHLYLLAMASLTLLGQQAAAGKQDDATAKRVYNALMGGKFRN